MLLVLGNPRNVCLFSLLSVSVGAYFKRGLSGDLFFILESRGHIIDKFVLQTASKSGKEDKKSNQGKGVGQSPSVKCPASSFLDLGQGKNQKGRVKLPPSSNSFPWLIKIKAWKLFLEEC